MCRKTVLFHERRKIRPLHTHLPGGLGDIAIGSGNGLLQKVFFDLAKLIFEKIPCDRFEIRQRSGSDVRWGSKLILPVIRQVVPEASFWLSPSIRCHQAWTSGYSFK